MLKNRINGKSYIGQTIRTIEKRFEEHQKTRSHCRALYNAIKKYGWDSFIVDYYECPDEDLNFDEELLVREMGTLSPNGYNLKEGGGNGKHSEETKQKMSESQTGEKNHKYGKKQSDDSNKKRSEAMTGENNHNYGKPISKQVKQKIREANSGDNNHMSKRVYQYDLYGNFIGSFTSCGEAGRHLNKDRSVIAKCARGSRRHKSAYKFKWSYTMDIFI